MKIVRVYCTHCAGKHSLNGKRGRLRFTPTGIGFRPDGATEYIALNAKTVEEGRVTIVLNGGRDERSVSVFVRQPLPPDPDRALREVRSAAEARNGKKPSRWTDVEPPADADSDYGIDRAQTGVDADDLGIEEFNDSNGDE
jgi:hypothetical protein